ncbi:hypothetical protein RJ641_025854 [Dillenia turbinata]|uniref:F-box/LRR-repeat protein 15-like leucin rich repeat domain-containing protein n=1 Tax=Dillenia turbinata TaxID=194707 RepID=A0AAN8WAJ9_9MAGN
MTVLRSREIPPNISPQKKLKKMEVEPMTPSQNRERSKNLRSSSVISSPTSLSSTPSPTTASLSYSLRRRSLRLASNASFNDLNVDFHNFSVTNRRKTKKGKNRELEPEIGTENVAVEEIRVSDKGVQNDDSAAHVEIVSEIDEEIRVSDVPEVKDSGFGEINILNKGVQNDESEAKTLRGKRNSDGGSSLLDSGLEGDQRVLTLRSGSRLAKRGVGGSKTRLSKNGKCRDNMTNKRDEKGKEKIGDNKVMEKRLEENRKDAGNERMAKLSDGELVGIEAKDEKQIEDVVLDKAGDEEGNWEEKVKEEEGDPIPKGKINGKRRFSREEKGKGTLVGVNLFSNGTDSEEVNLKVEGDNQMENAILGTALMDGVAAEDDIGTSKKRAKTIAEDEIGTSKKRAKAKYQRRGFREQHRDIARQNAARFAHFPSQERDEEIAAEDEGAVPASEDAQQSIEDWPGPFSTAMKIIRDRERKLNVGKESSSLERIKHMQVIWTPRKDRVCERLRPSPPSLQELCLGILAKNADAITSLEHIPDVMRHKLSHRLCDSRRMNAHFFDLLLCGSPTEIRIWDCSWLTEEQFLKSMVACDTSKLTVLQVDQSGRCIPDYILSATLAQSSNFLPALTTISLRGACRLSDVGLNALVSAAPALRSVNLSQCSLLTSDGINALANSLGSILRELYLDDCYNIDVMLILPAMKKLEQLEVLSLAGIQSVTDCFLCEFINMRGCRMKELILNDCVKLTDYSMKAIGENCSEIHALGLSNLCKLTDSAMGYLANGCQAIETLKLCRNAFSDEAIAAFLETSGGSLKELSLNNVVKVGYNTALSLARHSRNLLSLDLSWCRNLTDELLGYIVDNCSLLRVLKLFGCTQVTNELVEGHSNPQVQIIGLKMTPILEHMEVPNPQGPLQYSSMPVL